MPQNQKTGSKANQYGHETSNVIAEKIGAVSISETSNEFSYEGRLITIRCAKIGNGQVGVTYNMLDRIDSVIAAFQVEQDRYQLYEISPALYKQFMRDSKNEGHVGLITKKTLKEHGKLLSVVHI